MYVFMAIHYAEPGRQADLYRRMADMAESIPGVPGLIDIGPWVEHDGERVVGVSRWASRAAFEAAMPGSGAQRHHPRVGGRAARVSAPDSARSVVPRA
jgi:heme-degrading monooxygenase HmoA